jgi:hypothetical protein
MQKFKKVSIGLLLALVTVSAAFAYMAANYLVPVHINITAAPGITITDEFDVPLTVWEVGDLQRGQSKSINFKVKNTQGTMTLYLRVNSMTTDRDISSYLTMEWLDCNGYPIPGLPYYPPDWNCPIPPGSSAGPFTLRITAKPDAPVGLYEFTWIVQVFDSASG